MSLIYAHKINGKVRVLSDTKIYVDPNYKQQLEHELTKEESVNIIKYGMIKTVIYRENITISSAGHIEVFNKLLQQINERKMSDVDDILNEALSVHNKHNSNTDFIVTTDTKIYCIRNNTIEKSEIAWIGDSDAFNKFQELRLSSPQKTITVITEEETYEETDEYSPVDDSFKYIINEHLFDKVGGMLIICSYMDGKFQYNECYATYSGYNSKQVLDQEKEIIFEHNIEDGGFSYFAFNLDNYYAMNIEQNEKYLVYKPGYSNENYNYLALAFFMDESQINNILISS